MAIKIIKRQARIATAEVVSDGLVPGPAVQERTAEVALAEWKAFPSPKEPRTQCAYCGKSYIRPCREGENEGCGNWQRKMIQAAGNGKS
jgi:hypothetical protein